MAISTRLGRVKKLEQARFLLWEGDGSFSQHKVLSCPPPAQCSTRHDASRLPCSVKPRASPEDARGFGTDSLEQLPLARLSCSHSPDPGAKSGTSPLRSVAFPSHKAIVCAGRLSQARCHFLQPLTALVQWGHGLSAPFLSFLLHFP